MGPYTLLSETGVVLREFTEFGEQPGRQTASFGFSCSLLNYFLQDRGSLILTRFSSVVRIAAQKQQRCDFFTYYEELYSDRVCIIFDMDIMSHCGSENPFCIISSISIFPYRAL